MLDKNYNPEQVENKWRKYWDKNKIHSFDTNSKKPIFSIDTPPPTVSGAMHLGHSFSYSQQDFVARYKRMSGYNVFYPFGTDDNGLPTEKLIQNLKKVKSTNMSRSEFIDLCLKSLKEITPKFIEDWKALGISCDFEKNYSTIDKSVQKISQLSFIQLYKKGLIYKKEFPTIWDTEFQTPVAQAELEDKQKETEFITIKFKVDGKEMLIATTRPELLGACVAVFVNPNDKRYKNIIGKKAIVPIFNHEVPIIADESADMEKGTGILMICSYGDKYDVDAITRHKLNPHVIINKNGTLKIQDYKGLSVTEAREKITQDLEEKKLITDRKKIIHTVNVFEKSQKEIEFLPTEQWFIKILENKKELIKQGKKINWYPQHMFKRYENWVEGLDWDWSISRERHFGIPIPVWYDEKGNVVLPKESELPIDPVNTKKKNLIPETKVLDTWATSSLTPQIAASLTKKVKIPFSLRPQAHDIIRTWAFYTITKAFLHENKIPWNDIIISGFVTFNGEKMSKSKGNVIAPQDLMQKYGSDALRFWAANTKLGEDAPYEEKEFVAGKKFCTKLWNASKFSLMHLENYKQQKPKNLETMDKWVLIKLSKVIEKSTKSFESYDYSRTKSEVENFFWNTFCDNYLEFIKNRLYNPDKRGEESRLSAQYTLYHSLHTILKLMAPITPYITEEIFQSYFAKKEKIKSIHISDWPKKLIDDKDAEKVGDRFVEVVKEVRRFKAEKNVSLKKEVKLTLDKKDEKILKPLMEDLKATLNADISFGKFKVELA